MLSFGPQTGGWHYPPYAAPINASTHARGRPFGPPAGRGYVHPAAPRWYQPPGGYVRPLMGIPASVLATNQPVARHDRDDGQLYWAPYPWLSNELSLQPALPPSTTGLSLQHNDVHSQQQGQGPPIDASPLPPAFGNDAKAAPPAHSKRQVSVGINRQIMSANCPRALLTIIQSRGPVMDFFNISSALVRLPKLLEQQQQHRQCTIPQKRGHYHHVHGPQVPDAEGLDEVSRSAADNLAALMVRHIKCFDARGKT